MKRGEIMSKMQELPAREELPEDLTWDLKSIYESDQSFEESFASFEESYQSLASYQGTLADGADQLLTALENILASSRHLGNLHLYAHLKNDQDTSNAKYQELYDRVRSLSSQFSVTISWFQPELLAIDEGKIQAYIQENSELELYRHYLERLMTKKEHTLRESEEELLAGASNLFSVPGQTFSVLNNADLKFPVIEDEEGQKVQLTHGNYSEFLESKNRKVRENAFKNYYSVYEGLQNTFSTTLYGNVKVQNYRATVRNYSSARDAALSSNFIKEDVYDRLLEAVDNHLPSFHRYLKLRKKVLKLKDLHMYDMYTPLIKESSFEVTFEEAKEITLQALKPLGAEYQEILQKAFDERWIDVCENKGKRSGAYSSGNYDNNPYILLNWHDSLNNLYTLVHELGHSVHTYLTTKNQPYIYGDYPIFLAEIASTTNENLLTTYLLNQADTDTEKITILNQYLDGFKGTVFRQTQFAEFEHFMHDQAASGQPLTSHFLNEHYYELNKRYYGEDVVSDEEIALEWSRIPHFYYNYYVYQYATGFCASSALAEAILSDETGLNRYLSFLKAGQSDYPIEVMKEAGVDMMSSDYLNRAFEVFDRYLKQLEDLIQ